MKNKKYIIYAIVVIVIASVIYYGYWNWGWFNGYVNVPIPSGGTASTPVSNATPSKTSSTGYVGSNTNATVGSNANVGSNSNNNYGAGGYPFASPDVVGPDNAGWIS